MRGGDGTVRQTGQQLLAQCCPLGHTVGEWSAGWDPGMELPGHAPVLWACLVSQGALEQTGDSPSLYQAAPRNPLSVHLSSVLLPSRSRTEAGLQWEEEATHRDLETHSPAQSRVPGRTCVFGNGELWHHVACPTQGDM